MTTDNDLSYLKWLRVALLAICFLISRRWLVPPTTKEAGFWLLAFATVFWIAGAWSNDPVWALAYKGLFLASVVTGACIARTITCRHDLVALCRTISVAALLGLGLIGVFITMQNATDPIFVRGRFTVGDLNPNLLGQTVAILSLLTLFHAMIEHTVEWRIIAGACFGLLLLLLVLCGSRGALLMAAMGALLLLPILSHSSRLRIAISVFTVFITIVLMAYTSHEPLESTTAPTLDGSSYSYEADEVSFRIWDEGLKDTRSGIWRHGFRMFLAHPVLGNGWLSDGSRWATVQSAYLQVLIEAGLLGAVFLTIFLWKTFHQLRLALRAAWHSKDELVSFTYVMVALAGALLLHAAVESSAFVGTSPNSFLLGFAIGHTDLRLARTRRMRGAHTVASKRTLST